MVSLPRGVVHVAAVLTLSTAVASSAADKRAATPQKPSDEPKEKAFAEVVKRSAGDQGSVHDSPHGRDRLPRDPARAASFKIVEGRLSEIDVEGNRWFRSSYLHDRLELGVHTPVTLAPLQEQLPLLQQDRRIERVNAELRPGDERGESVLNVRVGSPAVPCLR